MTSQNVCVGRPREISVVVFFDSLFFNRATVHSREPIFAHNTPKDAVWCKEDPISDDICVAVKFGSVLP